jgi:DNA polymerase-3 subunit delta
MFYVFDGDDAFSLREELAALMVKMGDPATRDLNTTTLDGQNTTLVELRHHCDTLPFFTERRLVLVKGLLARLGQKGASNADKQFLTDLVTYLPTLPPTTRLIFVDSVKLARRHPVVALARDSDSGHIKTFEAPTGGGLARWVRGRVKQAGGQIEPQAVEMLCTFVGNDLYQLSHEIDKLVAYTDEPHPAELCSGEQSSGKQGSGGQRAITREDVLLLTPHARQANIFDMVDAIGRRDGRTASRIYHQLLDAGEHPLALLGMITRQFRLMIQVKELAPQLGTSQAIARELKQNPYPIKKILTQSKNYTPDQLRQVYHKLLETDVDIKTGRMEATLALDTLIAGLSRAA